MAKRKSLSKRTRFEVFKRDAFTCQYCGRTPPAVVLHADHILPVASGGENEIDNLITSCADCNLGKSDKSLSVKAPPISNSLERARELAEQTEAYNQFLLVQRDKVVAAIERLGLYWFNQIYDEQNKFCFGADRRASVQRFLRNLTEAEILEAMDIAFANMAPFGSRDSKTWRYFCGVCWKKIKGASTDEA